MPPKCKRKIEILILEDFNKNPVHALCGYLFIWAHIRNECGSETQVRKLKYSVLGLGAQVFKY